MHLPFLKFTKRIIFRHFVCVESICYFINPYRHYNVHSKNYDSNLCYLQLVIANKRVLQQHAIDITLYC